MTTTEGLALGNSENLMNCLDKEGCVYSDSKKKRPIEEHLYSVSNKKYLQDFPGKIDSGREETSEDTSNIDEGGSHILLDKFKVGKLSLENESAGSDIDELINEIHKKCDKRKKMIVQKQEHQIQEFNKVWEDKLSKLNKDYLLDAAVIRAMYGKGSETESRLMILDDKFAKSVAENKVLKDMQRKDLEAEQLAARNKFNQKVASWMSKAEAYISGERTGCFKTESLGSQDGKVSGCSESRTHILGAKEALPLAGQHGANINSSRTVQGKHDMKSSNSHCAKAEEVGCNDGGPSFSDILIPAVVEQINQPKHFHDGESIRPNPPASVDKVPGEMQLLELHGDVAAELPESVANEITDNVSPMDCGASSPIEELAGQDAIDLSDDLLNQRNETDGTATDNLDSSGQVLKISEQTEASQDFHLPLQQVHKSQDMVSSKIQVHTNSSPLEAVESELLDTATNLLLKEVADSERVDSAASVSNSELIYTAPTLQSNLELQDQVEPAIETQSTSSIEVAASENMIKTTPALSSLILQDEDELIDKDQDHLEIEVSKSGVADIATPVQSQIDAPAIQNCEQLLLMPVDESPSCSQLPSIQLESRIEMPSHESTSQLTEDVELLSSNLNVGPGTQSSLETSVSISTSFQDNVASETQSLLKDVLQLSGASHLPIYEVPSWNCTSLFSNPLVNELDSGHKETEELHRSLENTMSCLKSECEREMEVLVAEIQNKYKLKLDDAEAQFRLKNNELCKNQNKLLMSNLLADAFSSLNCLPTGPPLQQGSPSISMQHQQLLTISAGATALHHTSNLQNASLELLQIQTLPSTSPSQIYACPSVQAQHAAGTSSFSPRSRVTINASHPITNPLLQAYVPAAPQSVPLASWSSFQQNWQQQQLLSSSQHLHLGHPTTPAHTSLAALGVGHRIASTPESFGSLQQAYFDMLG